MNASTGQGDRPKGRNKGLLKEKLELEKIKTKDGRTRVTLKPIADELTFDKGFYVFIRALQLLRSHNEGVIIVGLGGASGSGKTAFSHKVKDFMPGIAIISMDMYNDASKLVDENFDDPRLTDYDLLLQNLASLKAGKPADVPIYDFKQSKRVGFTSVPVPESRIVVIEGIYALSERLKPLLDLRVSITGGVHFDLVKRVLRDINRSGQGPEEIIQQITDTVFPMYKAFIEPDLNAAQLKIHNSFNPFTGFMNATYILKSKRGDDMTQQFVISVLGEGAVTNTEAEIHDIHLLPPDEDPETCASWLRMRNRDGKYTLMFEEWVTEGDFIISPRIQFEVSVRVLGGLMSLGYQIGTIMRRTSTLMRTVSGDLTVKFDDVENLGKYVQVQGKDREKVASVASALHLKDFVPRSYIEQVQLSKLTTEFQTFTDAVRKRFSMSGNTALEALNDVYDSSPPPFGGFLGGRGSHGRGGSRAGRTGNGMGGMYSPGPNTMDDSLLSTSAPVHGSWPIPIQGSGRQSKPSGGSSMTAYTDAQDIISPSGSAAAAAGSAVGPSSNQSTDGSQHDTEPGSRRNSFGIDADASTAAVAATISNINGSMAANNSSKPSGRPPSASSGLTPTPSPPAGGKGPRGLLGQQLQRSSHQGSAGSLQDVEGANLAGTAATSEASNYLQLQQPGCQPDRSHRVSSIGIGAQEYGGSATGFGGETGVQILKRLQEQIEVIGDGFRRHSGMQLHLDALTHQYKHLNETMAALTAATQVLGQCVQQLQQQQQQQHQDGAALPTAEGVSPHDSPDSQQRLLTNHWQGAVAGGASSALLMLGAGVAVGAAFGVLLTRSSA